MYATKDREFAARGWSSEGTVSQLSVRGQLVLNVQSAALLPLVIPAQIVLFITSSQIGSAPQVLFLAAWLLGGINQHASTACMIRSNAGIYYIVTATLMLVTACGVRERPLLARKRACACQREKHLSAFAHRFLHDWVDPWRTFNFTMVFLTRALLMLGLVLFMTYIEYYFARVQHMTLPGFGGVLRCEN